MVPVLANAGLGLWALAYILLSDMVELTPVTLALIAMVASALLIWPAGAFADEPAADHPSWRNLGLAFTGKLAGLWLSVSLAVFFPALAIVAVGLHGAAGVLDALPWLGLAVGLPGGVDVVLGRHHCPGSSFVVRRSSFVVPREHPHAQCRAT